MNKYETLYIIDDDDTFQFIAQSTIQATGLIEHIRIFSNGLEAVRFLESVLELKQELPDIILLDLTMPVMDGWGFLENFMLMKPSFGKKIYVYIVSSSINPMDVERARSITEVTDYVVKPVTKDKFIELMKKL